MTKTKKKNNYHAPLVITGYTLYALLVIGVLLSTTIPFARMLFDPRVLHLNVLVFVISLTVGVLLPALVGYIIGGHSVRSKSKLSHHFNGVLFGFLAYQLMVFFAVLMPSGLFADDVKLRMIVLNLLPSIGVAVVTTILAVMHVRSRWASRDILDYKPFSLTLIIAIVGVTVWALVNNVITNTLNGYSFFAPAVILIFGAVAYWVFRKVEPSKYKRITWSAVSISVLFVAMFVMPPLVLAIPDYMQINLSAAGHGIVYGAGWALALIVWIVFVMTQVKSLRKKS